MCPLVSCNPIALTCFLTSSRPCSIVSFLGVKTELFRKPTAFVFWFLLVALAGERPPSNSRFWYLCLSLFHPWIFPWISFLLLGWFPPTSIPTPAALRSSQNKSSANQKPLLVFRPSSAQARAVLDTWPHEATRAGPVFSRELASSSKPSAPQPQQLYSLYPGSR